MAGNVKARVYTGATAALSVQNASGNYVRVAYVSDFTIDLSSNSEDFNVLGQLYQESIPTYNSWTASSSAKASFENDGQRLLIDAYNNLKQIKCEFLVDNANGVTSKMIKFDGWAIIESLSIGVGDGVSTFDISLKGSGDLDVDLPSIVAVTGIEIPSSLTLNVGDAKTIDYVLTPANASNPEVEWKLTEGSDVVADGDGTYVKLNQRGQVVAKLATVSGTTVTVTATAKGGTSISDTCTITVE